MSYVKRGPDGGPVVTPVPVSGGGTGRSTLTLHSILVGNDASPVTLLPVGTTNTVLLGATASDPVWGTVPNAALTNSSVTLSDGNNITITGSPLSLGGTATINVSGTTQYSVQVGDATGSLDSLAIGATNTALLGNTGANPSWGAVPNATLVNSSVTLSDGNNITITGSPLSLGGTATINVSGTTQYALQVGDATGSLDSLATGTATQILQSGGAAANPAWSTATYPATTTQGDIIYSSADNTVDVLAKNATATRYLANTGASNNPAWDQVNLANGVTGTLPVTSGGTGVATITDHGVMVGSGTSAITPLAVGTDGQVLVGSTAADPVFATISSTDSTIDITGGPGTLDLDLSGNVQVTGIHGWNGAVLETPAVTVTSDGLLITFSVEKSGGGDLTAVFSDGFYDWDTTPAATKVLTAGTDVAPQINYVYLLHTPRILTSSTTGFPATEHVPLATVLCQSAASLQTQGAYKVHAWTDHVVKTNDMGHIHDLNYWIRYQNATWQSGIAQTLTITPNVVTPDNVIFTSTSGTILQLHDHAFPAFSGTPSVYTVNDATTPYNVVTDLNALLTDSTGASMSAKYFTLVIWGVVSEASGDCKLMVNLPGGSYNTEALALADSQQYTNYTIPSDFIGTGFLIYEMTLRHQTASGGTWTSIREIDLRGLFPGTAAGGSNSFATEFADNTFRIYDDGDNTKEIAFQASAITTGTTRTITMDDRDIDMDAVPTTVATDGASATPAGGSFSIVGGTNIATSGAGSAVTVGVSGTIGVTNGGTGASSLTDHGVMVGSGTGAVTVLPVGASNLVLHGNTGADPTWGAVSLTADVTGTLSVANGGTGVTTITDHSLIVGSGTGAVTPLGVATNGQIPIGSTGADPTLATITAGENIGITNGAGSITVDYAEDWTTITTTDPTLELRKNYLINYTAGGHYVTLPAPAAIGDWIRIVCYNCTNQFQVKQQANMTIYIGANNTTTGTGGYLLGGGVHFTSTVVGLLLRAVVVSGSLRYGAEYEYPAGEYTLI